MWDDAQDDHPIKAQLIYIVRVTKVIVGSDYCNMVQAIVFAREYLSNENKGEIRRQR